MHSARASTFAGVHFHASPLAELADLVGLDSQVFGAVCEACKVVCICAGAAAVYLACVPLKAAGTTDVQFQPPADCTHRAQGVRIGVADNWQQNARAHSQSGTQQGGVRPVGSAMKKKPCDLALRA